MGRGGEGRDLRCLPNPLVYITLIQMRTPYRWAQYGGLIDNRIYNSRLNISHQLRRRKCPQFSRDKNGGHIERRAAIGRRNTPHHSYTSGSEEVPACVRNIVLKR